MSNALPPRSLLAGRRPGIGGRKRAQPRDFVGALLLFAPLATGEPAHDSARKDRKVWGWERVRLVMEKPIRPTHPLETHGAFSTRRRWWSQAPPLTVPGVRPPTPGPG